MLFTVWDTKKVVVPAKVVLGVGALVNAVPPVAVVYHLIVPPLFEGFAFACNCVAVAPWQYTIESPLKLVLSLKSGFVGKVPIVKVCAALLQQFTFAVTLTIPLVVVFVLMVMLFVVDVPLQPFGRVHV